MKTYFLLLTLLFFALPAKGQGTNGAESSESSVDSLEARIENNWEDSRDYFPDDFTITYGESPTSSGLTFSLSYEPNGWIDNVVFDLNAGQGYGIFTHDFDFGQNTTLSLGPSGGLLSQRPWISLFSNLTHKKLSLTAWVVGFSAGQPSGDLEAKPRHLFNFFSADLAVTDWLSIGSAGLWYESDDFNLLPTVVISPRLRDDLRLRMQVTLDKNAGWQPLFVFGITSKRGKSLPF